MALVIFSVTKEFDVCARVAVVYWILVSHAAWLSQLATSLKLLLLW